MGTKINSEFLRQIEIGDDIQRIKRTLNNGADVHIFENYAIRRFATQGSFTTVKLLFKYGADIHARCDEAFIKAAGFRYVKIVKFLLKKGANIHVQRNAFWHATLLCFAKEKISKLIRRKSVVFRTKYIK